MDGNGPSRRPAGRRRRGPTGRIRVRRPPPARRAASSPATSAETPTWSRSGWLEWHGEAGSRRRSDRL